MLGDNPRPGRRRAVPLDGWNKVLVPVSAAEQRKRNSTWLKPPVAASCELVGSDRPIHLVEGNAGYGALRSLVESGVLGEDPFQDTWIGKRASTTDDGAWCEVLSGRRNQLPYGGDRRPAKSPSFFRALAMASLSAAPRRSLARMWPSGAIRNVDGIARTP